MDRNDLLAAARALFLQSFTVPLDDVIERGELHMFRKADAAQDSQEQVRFLDSRSILLNKREALKRQLVVAIEHLLNRSFQTAYSTFRPSFGAAFNTESLSLIDTSAFEDELHIDEMTKQFRLAAEEELRDLNIRIALLFEQEEIRERENPFRPFLFARGIVNALEDIDTAPELIAPLSKQLAEDLTSHMQEIYGHLNSLLAENGIAAQLQFKIKKVPDTPASVHSSSSDELDVGSVIFPAEQSNDHHNPALDDDWVSPLRNRADDLLQLVQGGPDSGMDSYASSPAFSNLGSFATPPAFSTMAPFSSGPAFSAIEEGEATRRRPLPAPGSAAPRRSWLSGAKAVGEVLRNLFTSKPAHTESFPLEDYEGFEADELLATLRPPTRLTESVHSLQQTGTPQAEAMLRSDGRVRNLILEHRDELSLMSRDDEEQMIIDIVAMLFEFILRDPQVPAEVRAQLGRLQFLVLKVALLDPALFASKNHPARLLVNRIGSIVLGLQQIDPGGERVTAEIRRIVSILLADETGDASLFAQMLDEFDAFVTAILRTADQQVDRAVQALENAENRTLQFAHLTGMISDALTHITVDDFLHDFLVNTWARVIERAGRDDTARAKRLRVLVPDLVWSIIPKPTEQERKQLFGLIPVLLDSIREGVVLLGWTGPQQDELIEWLIDAHRHALRTGNQTASVPPLSYFYEQFADFINTALDTTTGAEQDSNWDHLDGQLLDEAINEMETELNLLDQIFDLDMNELMSGGGSKENAPTEENLLTEDEVTERLRKGVAIEMLLDEEPTRAHLTWVSQNSTNIVLSIHDVPTPTIVNVKVFRRLLETGRVRFVESAPLFERAVHSLLESADQLDHHGTAPK